MDVLRRIGEEEVTPAGHLHQRHTLAGQCLLDRSADSTGALGRELKVALVRDHRTRTGHDLAAQSDSAHLAALLLDPRAGHLGVGGCEQFASHGKSSLVRR